MDQAKLIIEICKFSRNNPQLMLKAYRQWLAETDIAPNIFVGSLSDVLVVGYENKSQSGNAVFQDWNMLDDLIEKMFERMKKAGAQ